MEYTSLHIKVLLCLHGDLALSDTCVFFHHVMKIFQSDSNMTKSESVPMAAIVDIRFLGVGSQIYL